MLKIQQVLNFYFGDGEVKENIFSFWKDLYKFSYVGYFLG